MALAMRRISLPEAVTQGRRRLAACRAPTPYAFGGIGVPHASGTLQPQSRRQWVATFASPQPAIGTNDTAVIVDVPGSSEVSPAEAMLVLQQLCLYVPRGRGGSVFGDGPANLARLRPYRRKEVAAALAHGRSILWGLSLRQLAGVASALAASRHKDPSFMTALAEEATQRLRAAGASCEWGPTCHLAMAFARQRALHPQLMEAVAAAATLALERGDVKLQTRRRASQLAALVGAFAALRLRPARLLSTVGEILKQQPSPLAYMGPWESVVMTWALGRLEDHNTPGGITRGDRAAGGDATTWALVLERATTQVGQLPRHDLCRAYAMLAAAKVDHPPLLAALRRAVRERLNLLKPPQLSAMVVALAHLEHRDALLTDEVAIWVHHKAINFSPTELASTLAGLAALRYRNPWLLGRLSRVMASLSLGWLQAMTGAELATVAAALADLRWPSSVLLNALGDEMVSRLGPEIGNTQRLAAASPPAPVSRRSVDPHYLAVLVTSLATLRHHHAALLSAACALAAQDINTTGSAWSLEDRVAVVWAASLFASAPPLLLQRLAHDAADNNGLPLDHLVRLAWSCAAHQIMAGHDLNTPDSATSQRHEAAQDVPLACLVPLLQQSLTTAIASKGGSGRSIDVQAAVQALAVLGPELPQLAEAVRRLTGTSLLPAAVENSCATAASAALAQGERGATLRLIAAELDRLLAQRAAAGAGGRPAGVVLRIGYRVPESPLLIADIALLPSKGGGSADTSRPLALLLIDNSAATSQDGAILLMSAELQRALFAAVGWEAVYIFAEAWVATAGKAESRQQMLNGLLDSATCVR